jgi:hypothetical protein
MSDFSPIPKVFKRWLVLDEHRRVAQNDNMFYPGDEPWRVDALTRLASEALENLKEAYGACLGPGVDFAGMPFSYAALALGSHGAALEDRGTGSPSWVAATERFALTHRDYVSFSLQPLILIGHSRHPEGSNYTSPRASYRTLRRNGLVLAGGSSFPSWHDPEFAGWLCVVRKAVAKSLDLPELREPEAIDALFSRQMTTGRQWLIEAYVQVHGCDPPWTEHIKRPVRGWTPDTVHEP